MDNNLKEKILTLLNNQKEYLKNYIFSFFIIIITTLLMVFLGFENDTFNKIYIFLILTFILVFLTETIIKKNIHRIIPYIISILISIASIHFIFLENISVKMICLLIGIYSFASITAIYKIIDKSENNLSNFLVHLFQNNIFLGIIVGTMQTGIIFIVSIISELLLNNSDIELYLKAELLIFGLIILPLYILSLLNTKQKIIKFVKIIICYIMLSIISISYFIIYLYFLKIFITFNIPSNQIFRIIAILFIFSFPTWTMINYFKNENKFMNKVSVLLPILFIPFILTQIYSISIRIIESGITIIRYLGIILIIFEFISVIFSLEKYKNFQNKIVLILGVLILITTSIPYINAIDISYSSQLNIIRKIYKENMDINSLSTIDKKRIMSSYNYIQSTLKLENKLPNYINNNLSNADDYIVDDYNVIDEDYPEDNTKHISYYDYNKLIDISSYSKMENVQIDEISENVDLLNLEEFNDYIDKDIIKTKIKENIKNYMDKQDISNNIININESYTFYIVSLDINYNVENLEIDWFRLEGYLLIK